MGWQDAPMVSAANEWEKAPLVGPKNTEPSKTDSILRNVALTGRALGEGVFGILDLLKSHPKEYKSPSLSDALTSLGAPVPETSGEQYASAGIRGMAGALSMSPGASIPNAIRAGIAGGSSGLGSEASRQHGGSVPAQILAGLLAGAAPSAIEETGRALGRAAYGMAKPLMRSGQEQMAADLLGSQAQNPQAAAANLRTADEVVPGSPRSTGEASKDIGLLALEKGVRGKNAAAFGQRLSEQNAARQSELSALGGTQSDILAAQTARDAETSPMREAALGAGGKADVGSVHAKIDEIMASPSGARQTVASTMGWVKDQIGDESDPARLYEIRKDLQLAQAGKLQPSSQNAPQASTLAQTRGQLKQVVGALDDSIEQAAPGFKAYLERYKEMSGPIDQMKVIQEIKNRASLSASDITTGEDFLSAAKFDSLLDKAIVKSGEKLTQNQVSRLEAIRTDLKYGQAINSPLVKAPGSDTFQNLSIAQVLGAGATDAHPIFKVLSSPLKWLYRQAGSDTKVNEIIADAMLDPKLAAQMLDRATHAGLTRFSMALRARAAAAGLVSNASQQMQQSDIYTSGSSQ
jgi:hypothetical protein